MFQALPRALAGHLDEAQRRQTYDVSLCTIAGERAARAQHLPPMRLIVHVDEINNDDAAEIAQPQLSAMATLPEVGPENSFLEIAVPDIRAGSRD